MLGISFVSFLSLLRESYSTDDDLSRQLYTLWFYYFSFLGKTKSTSCTSYTLMIQYKVFKQLAVFSTKGSPQNAIQEEKGFDDKKVCKSCMQYTHFSRMTQLLYFQVCKFLYFNLGKQTYNSSEDQIDILRVTWQFCVLRCCKNCVLAGYLLEQIAHENIALDRLSRRFHLIRVCTNKCIRFFAKSFSQRRIA